MSRPLPAAMGLAVLTSLAVLLGGAPACGPSQELQVAAAVSLRDSLADLVDETDGARTHLAASGVLVRQILDGAGFDVVILAGTEEMDRLDAEGALQQGTRTVIATNRLVLGVPAWDPPVDRLEDLTGPRFSRIAIGSPSTVPAGRYAFQTLERAGLQETLQDRLVYAGHARQVLQYLERGEVDAGFLYRSDAVSSAGVRSCIEIDPANHDPIRYEAAVLRDAVHPEQARAFVARMAGSRGDVALRRYGFGPPG